MKLPATSAACERSFSTYSAIHTSKRNRLTNDRAAKIVYIAHNLKLQSSQSQQFITPQPQDSISNKESEICETVSEARTNEISLDDETDEHEISDSSIMNFEDSENENDD